MQRVSEEEEGDDEQVDSRGNTREHRMGMKVLPRRLFLTNGKLEFTLRAIPRSKEEERQEKKER